MQGLLVASAALTSLLELLLSRRTLLFRTLSVTLDLGACHAPLCLKLRRRPVQTRGSNGWVSSKPDRGPLLLVHT